MLAKLLRLFLIFFKRLLFIGIMSLVAIIGYNLMNITSSYPEDEFVSKNSPSLLIDAKNIFGDMKNSKFDEIASYFSVKRALTIYLIKNGMDNIHLRERGPLGNDSIKEIVDLFLDSMSNGYLFHDKNVFYLNIGGEIEYLIQIRYENSDLYLVEDNLYDSAEFIDLASLSTIINGATYLHKVNFKGAEAKRSVKILRGFHPKYYIYFIVVDHRVEN